MRSESSSAAPLGNVELPLVMYVRPLLSDLLRRFNVKLQTAILESFSKRRSTNPAFEATSHTHLSTNPLFGTTNTQAVLIFAINHRPLPSN